MKLRYYLLLPLFILSLFITDVKVQAISEFDNTYRTTDTLLLKADYYGVNEDVTINWQQLFLNPEGLTSEIYPYQFTFNYSLATTEQIADMRDSWVNRKENWSVSQEWTNSEKTMGNIIVSWSESKNQSLDWISANHNYEYPSQVRVTNNNYELEITQNIGGNPNDRYYQVNIYTNRSSTAISNGNEYPWSIRENFLSYVNNPIYPEGYEGQQIREVAPSAGVSDIPNLYIQNILNNKVTFYDSNFFTFDDVPFTCDSGGVPVIYYELYKLDSLDEVLVLEGYNSASNLYEYDAGSSDIERNYRIIAWYYCGDDDLKFTDKASLEFTITPQGTQKYDIWDNCLTDTFPYFNMESCWSATLSVYELLFTGKISFPNWTFDATCHSMNSLDDWLGLQSGYVLCPQFPAYVRNTVTPFIAFLLGIVTIGMIRRRAGS